MIHDLNLTINYWILLLEQSIMQCSMSIIVVCQIVNSGLTIISMYSSVFVMAVCRKLKGGEPIFLGETEGVIIKTGYIH